jgi:hypothetical protein
LSDAWVHVEGMGASRVVVYEDTARRGMLTLRWWAPDARTGTNRWHKRTLGRVIERERRGGDITEECRAFAVSAAQKKSLELAGLLPSTAGVKAPVTLGRTEAMITDPDTGKYPHDSSYRREVVTAIRYACAVWGADKRWSDVSKPDWTMLMRRRLGQLLRNKEEDRRSRSGLRGTEVTLTRLHTVVTWLRENDHIAETDARWPGESTGDWKDGILEYWRGVTKETRAPQPFRPRHTHEDVIRILRATSEWYDRRFELLMWLGMELRLGQVVRSRRSDMLLTDNGEWRLVIHGSGKKGGTTVELTAGQVAVWLRVTGEGGYLEDQETAYSAGRIADYLLFPAGHMKHDGSMGRNVNRSVHVSRDWARENFVRIESIAKVPHIDGRSTYGVRRQGRDVADELGLTRSGVENFGAWSPGSKVPDEVYRNRENRAGMKEATKARAALRGEPTDA